MTDGSGDKYQFETDKRMYKVRTTLLKEHVPGDKISRSRKERLVQQGCPDFWFEAVPNAQEGQYWKWSHIENGGIIRIKSTTERLTYDYISEARHTGGCCDFDFLRKNATLLSTDEIEQALTEEAKRRGFVNGKRIVTVGGEKVTLQSGFISGYDSINDCLRFAGKTIYKKGHWAEIITDEWEVKERPFMRVTNGEVCISTISSIPLPKEQAEEIKKALNNL